MKRSKYPFSQMPQLAGMILQDFRIKGKRILFAIISHPKVLLPFFRKQKNIATNILNKQNSLRFFHGMNGLKEDICYLTEIWI